MICAATMLLQKRRPFGYPLQILPSWSKVKKLIMLEMPCMVMAVWQAETLGVEGVVEDSADVCVHSVPTRPSHLSPAQETQPPGQKEFVQTRSPGSAKLQTSNKK